MIRIGNRLALNEGEISFEFLRASGPGGQNVNKVSTAVRLRFDVRSCPSLPEDVRARLARLAGRRIGADGVLAIEARRYRTQEANRRDALERFVQLVGRAAEQPRLRRETKPPAASRARRLEAKRRRSLAKQARHGPDRAGD